MKKLLSLNIDINQIDKSGRAPLHYIIEAEEAQAMTVLELVLQVKDVRVDVQDGQDSRTPLHYALLKSSRELTKLLLDAGADPNKTDKDWSNGLFFAT